MRALRILLGLLLVGLAVGCGTAPPAASGPPVKVSGKVTLNGQALPEGSAQFIPTEKGRDQGVSFKNGSFETEMLPGKYKVTVAAQGVPAKYTKPESTDLTTEVTSAGGEIKLAMTK
jgi:hypothetical protein